MPTDYYDYETELLKEYDRTKCTCEQDRYKICHYHKLVYCLICDGFLCPKCDVIPPEEITNEDD